MFLAYNFSINGLGNEVFEEKALSFNHWEKGQCPHFTAAGRAWRSPWALSHPGVRFLWREALNPSLGNSTHCMWVAGGVASSSPVWAKTGTKCGWNPPDGLPSNTKCNYSPRLDKTLESSSRTGSTASSAGVKGGEQQSCMLETKDSLHCISFVRHLPKSASLTHNTPR